MIDTRTSPPVDYHRGIPVTATTQRVVIVYDATEEARRAIRRRIKELLSHA